MADVYQDTGAAAADAKPDSGKEWRDRYAGCVELYRSIYRDCLDDMRFAFVPGEQWDEWMRKTRSMGGAERPMPEFNKLRQAIRQVLGDQRQNRPGPKIRAVEDGDTDLAEVRQGIIRNIEATSHADRAYDNAFEFAVGGGYGVYRIETAYADDGFDLDIKIVEVRNPFSVWFDPAAREFDRRDARYAFVDQVMPVEEYKDRWPGAEVVSADTEFCVPKDGISWFTDKTVRVCEYWYKEKASKEIAQLSDSRVVDVDEKLEALAPIYEANGITVLRTRTVDYDQVKHCIVSGKEILEGPNDWPGKFIPIVPVWGDIVNIEGKDVISGMTRFSKDAQRAYNFERATFMETLAVQPSAPFVAPAQSIIKYRSQYENIGVTNVPVLLYDADPKLPNGGKPERAPPPAFPAALANAAQISSDDIKATSGIYDASLGARSNETSGKAILARQREGDVSNFVYIDNLAYAMRYGYEIINDLIPKVYDTERQIRIIGDDGGEKVIRVNKAVEVAPGDFETMYDLSQGKFDIAVTVGPSYTTQRMETAEALQQFAADPSPLGMLAKYGFLKALDTPGMEEIVKAARKMLVGGGLLEPQEGDEPPPPPQPDPKAIADAEKAKAGARLDNAKAEGQELDNQAQMFVRDALVGPAMGMVSPPLPPPMAQAGFGPPDPADVLPMGPMGA